MAVNEYLMISRLAIPVALHDWGRIGMVVTDSVFIGHLGILELTAVSWAAIFMEMSLAPVWGICDALGVLGAQAYGAGQYDQVGGWFQIAAVLSMIVLVPTMTLWWFVSDLLVLVNVPQITATLAGRYVRISMLGLVPYVTLIAGQRFLICQGTVRSITGVTLLALLLNAGLNWMLVFGVGAWSGMGLEGSAYATAVSRLLQTIALFTWSRYRGMDNRTWTGWRCDYFIWARIRSFMSIAGLMIICECMGHYQLQAIALMAADMGSLEIVTQNILTQMYYLGLSPIYGLRVAGTQRIGLYLGAGVPLLAKGIVWTLSGCTIAFTVIEVIILWVGRNAIGPLYSNESTIQGFVDQNMAVVGSALITVALFTTGVSVLEGQGRPLFVALGVGIGWWGVGLTTAYYMAIVNGLGLSGLWWGLTLGNGVAMIIAGLAVLRSDWSEMSRVAVARAHEDVWDSLVSLRDFLTLIRRVSRIVRQWAFL